MRPKRHRVGRIRTFTRSDRSFSLPRQWRSGYRVIIEDDHSAFSVLVGGLLGSVAILPRRNRVGLTPKSALLLPGFSLGLPIARLNVGAGTTDILLEYSGEAAAHLIQICIEAINRDGRQDAGRSDPVTGLRQPFTVNRLIWL